MLHAPQLPPEHMRYRFWAQRAPIQHRSSGISAAAAPAPTQLSATQHLPASDRDAAVQSCCGVPPMLHAPICPRNTCAIISGRNVRRYSIAQAAFQRLRHQHYAACCDTAFACIQARCRHAKLLRSVSDASCTPSTPGTDALNILRRPPIDKRCWRCNSATAAQHQRSLLRHSICLHPSTMPPREAAAECLRCFMHPIYPRNRCAEYSAPAAYRQALLAL